MKEIIINPILLILVSILTGQVLGKVSIKQIKLGSSAVMFTGVFFSYFVTSLLIGSGEIETFSRYVPPVLFQLSLIGFIVAVGLLAGKNMKETIKEHGFKFLLLAILVTLTGGLSTFIFARYVMPDLSIAVLGTYVGALTSSPGLATALEAVEGVTELEALIGVGYSISYIPGVAAVVLFVQLVGKSKKTKVLKKIERKNEIGGSFCLMSFSFVCLLGVLLGQVRVYLGNYLGYFSLGITGGVLVSSLIFGGVKSKRVFDFNFDSKALAVIRDISLNMFLAIVGLNFGYSAIFLIQESGFALLFVGLTTAIVCILVGYFFGRKVLKLPKDLVLGGLCGGMTSTPGLAAAIEAIDSDEVTVGYGATYPFALFFIIIFVKILANL